ncbi:hypothetical protein MRX96_056330 [Rhipicephalus microplus]
MVIIVGEAATLEVSQSLDEDAISDDDEAEVVQDLGADEYLQRNVEFLEEVLGVGGLSKHSDPAQVGLQQYRQYGSDRYVRAVPAAEDHLGALEVDASPSVRNKEAAEEASDPGVDEKTLLSKGSHRICGVSSEETLYCLRQLRLERLSNVGAFCDEAHVDVGAPVQNFQETPYCRAHEKPHCIMVSTYMRKNTVQPYESCA